MPDKASPSPGPLFSPPILSGTFTITADDPARPAHERYGAAGHKDPLPGSGNREVLTTSMSYPGGAGPLAAWYLFFQPKFATSLKFLRL